MLISASLFVSASAEINIVQFKQELKKGNPSSTLVDFLQLHKQDKEVVTLIKQTIIETKATPQEVANYVKAAIKQAPTKARLIQNAAVAVAPDAHDAVMDVYLASIPSSGKTTGHSKGGKYSFGCDIFKPQYLSMCCGMTGYVRDANANVLIDGAGKVLRWPVGRVKLPDVASISSKTNKKALAKGAISSSRVVFFTQKTPKHLTAVNGMLADAEQIILTDATGKNIRIITTVPQSNLTTVSTTSTDAAYALNAQGAVIDTSGQAITDHLGNAVIISATSGITVDRYGVMLDSEQNPILDAQENVIKVAVTPIYTPNAQGVLVNAAGDALKDNQGNAITAFSYGEYQVNHKGQVMHLENQLPLNNANGTPIILKTANGKFSIANDGTLLDAQGNKVRDEFGNTIKILSRTGYEVLWDGTVIQKNGTIVTDPNGDILKLALSSNPGFVKDSYGKIIKDCKDQPIKLNNYGQIVGANGKPLKANHLGHITDVCKDLLKDSKGVPLRAVPWGRVLHPKTLEPLDITSDGKILKPNGSPILDQYGKPLTVYRGNDPLKANGSYIRDSKGNILSSNSRGFLLNTDGSEIKTYPVGFVYTPKDQVSPTTTNLGFTPLDLPGGGLLPGSPAGQVLLGINDSAPNTGQLTSLPNNTSED